jgi:hypothetical protein
MLDAEAGDGVDRGGRFGGRLVRHDVMVARTGTGEEGWSVARWHAMLRGPSRLEARPDGHRGGRVLARAFEVGRFAAVLVGLPVLFAFVALTRPALAGVPGPGAPFVFVDDAPFTRNQVVTVAIDADYTHPSPAVEWYASNDPATSNGQLVNRVAIPTGVGDWTLPAGPDGVRTIYGQTHHEDGSWSEVGSLTLTLDTSPGSRLAIDVDVNARLDDSGGDPPQDWHQILNVADVPVYGDAHTWAGGQSVSVSADRWGVTFSSNTGPIVTGIYTVPAPGNDGSCGTSCAGVSRAFQGTCLGGGTFTITSISITPDDDLETLVGHFRLTCFGSAMAGSIRYGSDADVSFFDQSAETLSFGDTDIGETSTTKSVTFTNDGDVPNTLGTASITGAAAAEFAIVTDTCSGATIAVGASCSIAAEFTPAARAHRFAALAIPDSTPKQGRNVRLAGAGWQTVTLDLDVVSLPQYGPAEATIKVIAFDVGVDVTGPGLLIDGESPVVVSLTSAVLTGPLRSVTNYVVELGPGSYELEGVFGGAQHAFYRDADPVSEVVAVGTESWLELTPTTDDGVMLGEPVDLKARLLTGGPVTGTLQIREGTDGPIVASQAVTGNTELFETFTLGLGSHPYSAAFVPTSPDTQPATSGHTVEVVDGPRPETEMDATPLASWAQVQTEFESPTPGVAFECQSRLLENEEPFVGFYPCTSPTWFLTNTKGWNVILVRSRLPSGLADRTPASRLWYFDWDLTGTTAIDDGATYADDPSVTVSTMAPEGAPSVTHVGLSNDGVTWTTRQYSASQAWTLAGGSGQRTVYTRWRDAGKNWSTPATDTIILDTKAPTTSAPSQAFVEGSRIEAGKIPVKVTWSGADATSGVASYRIAWRRDGGSWSKPVGTDAPTLTRLLERGHSYRFRVRAIDEAGNVGAWKEGAAVRVSGVQQSAGASTYVGSWSPFSSSSFWGGSVKASSDPGSKVRFTFTGRAFGWLTTIGPDRGEARIYVNGALLDTVDLAAATSSTRVIGWSKTWATFATRTIEIRVVGTPDRPRIDVDGFWTLR